MVDGSPEPRLSVAVVVDVEGRRIPIRILRLILIIIRHGSIPVAQRVDHCVGYVGIRVVRVRRRRQRANFLGLPYVVGYLEGRSGHHEFRAVAIVVGTIGVMVGIANLVGCGGHWHGQEGRKYQ